MSEESEFDMARLLSAGFVMATLIVAMTMTARTQSDSLFMDGAAYASAR